VRFAGDVAGSLAVTIDHGSGLETTYSRLSTVGVREGQHVTRAQFIGRVGEAHPGVAGLHFGVKIAGGYVDPRRMLGPLEVADAVHLVPLDAPPPGDPEGSCRAAPPLGGTPPPPDGDVAVAVAGIGSHTKGGVAASIYDHGPVTLGYPAGRVFRFSYRGSRGPRLHQPYSARDTYGDIRQAARRLAGLLRRVHRRFPKRDVDLIAHSQGGVVARAFLELHAGPWSAGLPHVDHVVTFSTPHTGAPLAGDVAGFDRSTLGFLLNEGLSLWSRYGGSAPDPRSRAVEELAPHSQLMSTLAVHDVVYGTKVLALAMPTDWVVPADHAVWEGKYSRVVGPSLGLGAHSAIVRSEQARRIAYAFLRDAPRVCTGEWDRWGPLIGGAIGFGEGLLPAVAAGAGRGLP
jgi:hypothetical protein